MSTTPKIETRNFEHAKDTPIAVQSQITSNDAEVPHLMFCSGFHSAMAGNKATAIHTLCQTQGWNYTRFDYRGHGLSGGVAAELTLQDWLADTLAVFDDCNRPTLLIGSSMGAWLASLVALRRPDTVKALLLLAAAPDFLQELVSPGLGPSETWDLQQGQAITLPGRYDQPYPITQRLLDSGIQLSVLSDSMADTLACPVRLIHGSRDEDVPYQLSVRLMEKLASPDSTLTLINHADHRLSDAGSINHINEALLRLVSSLRR